MTSARAPAIEQHVHHYWHGVTAEDVAAMIAGQALPELDVNRPDPPHVP